MSVKITKGKFTQCAKEKYKLGKDMPEGKVFGEQGWDGKWLCGLDIYQ